MEWEKEARELTDAIPVHDIIKGMVILYAEKMARKNKSKVVDLKRVGVEPIHDSIRKHKKH